MTDKASDKMPKLTVQVATLGVAAGRPIARCLQSIDPQLGPDDEVLVLGDTADGEQPETAELVKTLGKRYRYIPVDAGHHCWGHCQHNEGLTQAKGDFLVFQDDDDVFLPEAFDAIRAEIAKLDEPRPLFFRFRSYHGLTLWHTKAVTEGLIGGHCAVLPNQPDRLGRFTDRYNGDFDLIRSTLDLYPKGDKAAVWVDHIITQARPDR